MDRPVRPEAARAAGFTLIELLVVMLIVAMVSSVVVLNMPPPVTDEKTEAEAFAARLAAAAERAIMTGTTIGLELEPGAYRFYRFERGEWRPLNDRRIAGDVFSADTAVEFVVSDPASKNEEREDRRRARRQREEEPAPEPVVFFGPTGETTTLEASFASRRGAFSVTLDEAGNIALERR